MERPRTSRLYIRDPVRLECQGKPIRLRRKALAVLVYLSIAGPTRREVLAELLWGHSGGASNLRVELHSIRVAGAALWLWTTGLSAEPLRLPIGINLAMAGDAEFLAGLSGLTPAFDDWLDVQRSRFNEYQSYGAGPRLVDQALEPGQILILEVQPGTSGKSIANILGREHGFKVVHGFESVGQVMHYLGDARNYSADVVGRIVEDGAGIWALKQLSGRVEPDLVLALRAHLSPDRVLHLKVAPYDWPAARGSVLSHLSFATAAETFLASSGHHGYIEDYLHQLAEGRSGAPWEVPPRVRAAYLLEARRLSEHAQRALEACSTIEVALNEEHIRTLKATDHIDELERQGWLTFDGAWNFMDETARKVLCHSVQPGRAHMYRMALANAGLQDDQSAREYRAGPDYLLQPEDDRSETSLCSLVEESKAKLGNEVELLEARAFGPGTSSNVEVAFIVRQSAQLPPSGVEWRLPRSTTYVTIRGTSHGTSSPDWSGPRPRRAARETLTISVLDFRGHTGSNNSASHEVALTPEFQVGLPVSGVDALRIECFAPGHVIELQVSAYDVVDAPSRRVGSSIRTEQLPPLPSA